MLNFILGFLLSYSVCITLMFFGSVARWYEAKKNRELALRTLNAVERILYAVDPMAFYDIVDRGAEAPETVTKEN